MSLITNNNKSALKSLTISNLSPTFSHVRSRFDFKKFFDIKRQHQQPPNYIYYKYIYHKNIYYKYKYSIDSCAAHVQNRAHSPLRQRIKRRILVDMSCMGTYYVLNTYYVLYFTYNTLHTYRAKQGCTQLYTAIHYYTQLYTAIQS